MAKSNPIWHLDRNQIWLSWLIRLRWVAIAAQITTLLITFPLFQSPYLVVALFAVSGTLICVNLFTQHHFRQKEPIRQTTLFLQLCVDIWALTAFFFLSGGVENPFTSLYMIHVALAAIVLEPIWAIATASTVIGSYAFIHSNHYPLDLQQTGWDPNVIIPFGRILSHIITTSSITAFVMAIATSLRDQETALHESRERTSRTDRLRSVGTLAAGAAHELNTPLTTIGLRLRRVSRRHEDEDTNTDIDVMRSQLQRCTDVVKQLLVSAGDPSASDISTFSFTKTVQETIKLWSKGNLVQVEIQDDSDEIHVELPKIAFCTGLINLLQNALEAQAAIKCSAPLEVYLSKNDQNAILVLRDHGIGLPKNLDQIGEPFFTTKTKGTGLGVYVARAVVDGAGGRLHFEPHDGYTEIRLIVPIASKQDQPC
jgi:two-component system sensor histidine kinase RegB